MQSTEELIAKLNDFLQKKTLGTQEYLTERERLASHGLEALAATKSILQDVYAYSPPSGSSITRRLKNKIINLVRNVTISTVELVMIKQNKFNELSYQFIALLLEENKKLYEEIEKLKNGK